MSDRLEIKITGSNQASAAFQSVTRDATQMGSAVDQAGQKASRSLTDLSAKSALVGAAIGSATLVLGEWSRAAAEDAAAQSRLQQSIENTGKSYDEYSDAVEKAIKAGQDKAFSDDATREALVRLNAVTNDTGQSLDQLSLAMDFARARGISLADSAGIIAKVYGGNLGILTRYGIVLGENATAEEALAKIQQISAGQAATYAQSDLGWIDKKKDKWNELTESIGASTGELQQFLMLMPGLSAGATALTGLVGAVGGFGTLAKLLGPAALVAGGASLAYGYSQDTIGTTDTNQFWNNFFKTGSGAMNALLPGNPYDVQKYNDQIDANKVGDVINSLFRGPGSSQDEAVARANFALGNPGFAANGQNFTADELVEYIMKQAADLGITAGDYILRKVESNSAIVQDPVTGVFMGQSQLIELNKRRTSGSNSVGTTTMAYGSMANAAAIANDPYGGKGIYNPFYQLPTNAPVTADNPWYDGPGPTYAAGGTGAVANSLSGIGTAPIVRTPEMDAAAQATQQKMLTDALIAQYPAWQGIIEGMNSAADAQSAFKGAQDNLIGQQSVYSQQQSEYQGQLSALTAGYEILQQRQADGQKLTKEEQELLDKYPGYYERLTGGVEDATVAEALLAAQYAENMAKGDEMNQKLGESTGATQDLVGVIEMLILSMDGVPEEVKTQILLNGADDSIQGLINYLSYLNSIPGSVTTVIETQYVTGTDGGGRARGARLGGVVGYANGGTVRAELAEAGPELLHFRNGGSAWAMERGLYNVPRGTYVDTAPASKLKAGNGGGVNNFYGSVTVIANNPQQFMDAMRESNIGGSRS